MTTKTKTETRCRERVGDNGDCYSCDNVLPCERHPAEQVAARKALEAIGTTIEKAYRHNEHYADRMRAVARIVDEYRADYTPSDDPLASLFKAARDLDKAEKGSDDNAHQNAECEVWSAAIKWSRATST